MKCSFEIVRRRIIEYRKKEIFFVIKFYSEDGEEKPLIDKIEFCMSSPGSFRITWLNRNRSQTQVPRVIYPFFIRQDLNNHGHDFEIDGLQYNENVFYPTRRCEEPLLTPFQLVFACLFQYKDIKEALKKAFLECKTETSKLIASGSGVTAVLSGFAGLFTQSPQTLYEGDQAICSFLGSFIGQERKDAITAFLLSRHPRVGHDSPISRLPKELYEEIILCFLFTDNLFPLPEDITKQFISRLMQQKTKAPTQSVSRCVIQ